MADVAKRAGVSQAAVSYVFNGKQGVSEETRAKILGAAEALGYQINKNIQDFVRETTTGASHNIGLVFVGVDFSDPAYAGSVDGVARGTEENNYHLVFSKVTGEEKTTMDLPPILRDGRVDGILVTGVVSRDILEVLGRLEIPIVVLGNYSDTVTKGYSVVEISIRASVDMVVECLKDAGRKRIAYFSEELTYYFQRECIKAFKEALIEHELPVCEDIIYIGEGGAVSALPVLMPIFAEATLPFDAIFCADSTRAIYVSHIIMARKVSNPSSDVLLATFRPYSHYELPVPAVYADVDMHEMAHQGVTMLLDNISKKTANGSHKLTIMPIAVELVPGMVASSQLSPTPKSRKIAENTPRK
jgi:LacI family transcriptional regulator